MTLFLPTGVLSFEDDALPTPQDRAEIIFGAVEFRLAGRRPSGGFATKEEESAFLHDQDRLLKGLAGQDFADGLNSSQFFDRCQAWIAANAA